VAVAQQESDEGGGSTRERDGLRLEALQHRAWAVVRGVADQAGGLTNGFKAVTLTARSY
jgi:hypothetical protein